MADHTGAPKPTVRQRVKNELWATTPGWSRKLLVFAFLLMIAGFALPLFFNKPVERAASPQAATPSAASGFVSGGGAPSAPAPASPSSSGTTSSIPGTSTAAALGLSFFAGFIVAWVLRLFFKIGLLIAALIVASVVALKYFGVNIDTPDLSGFTQHAQELGQQATQEAGKLMAYVKTIVPSGMAAAAGLFVGWRRR